MVGMFFFLSLLISIHSQTEDIVNLSLIPQFPQDYTSKIRAGYLNITPHTQPFYYILAESQNNRQTDPVILWLNGGPGCSSLVGFFNHNGPFRYIDETSSNMTINDYAWNKRANVIYLQSPSGVGFSQTSSKSPLVSNDTAITKDHLVALTALFLRYQFLQGSEFYLSGQGYAGIYIVRLAEEILDFNDDQQELKFNLQGIILGNAVTHPFERYTAKYFSRFTAEFLFTRGFIQQNQYNQYKSACLTSQNSANCLNIQQTLFNNFYATKASIYNIYDKCYTNVFPPKRQEETQQLKDEIEITGFDDLSCIDVLRTIKLLNNNKYREALKVGESSDNLVWLPCSNKITYNMEQKAAYSTLPTLVSLGLKIFYYSGDLDASVPIQGTLYWVNQYRNDNQVSIKKNWRPWVSQKQSINGMVWQLQSMTLVTFRGAGHMVASDKPAQAFQMLNVFLGLSKWKYPDYLNTNQK